MTTLASIQALRAIAASMVVVLHCFTQIQGALGESFPLVLRFVGVGAAGVHIFFVISGFIMVYTNHVHFGDSAHMGVFARRRLVRIYPIYLLLALINLPILFALGVERDLETVVLSLLLVPYKSASLIYVGWTLSFEVFFYMVFCLLLPLRGWRPLYALTGVFVGLVALRPFVPVRESDVLHMVTNTLLLEFVAGAWIAWAFIRLPALPVPLATATLLLGMAGLGATIVWPNDLPSLVAYGAPSTLIVVGCLYLEAFPRAARVFARLQRLGDASYTLYLIHPVVLFPVATFVIGGQPTEIWEAIVWAAAMLALISALAIVVSERVEMPMNRAINALLARRRRSGLSG